MDVRAFVGFFVPFSIMVLMGGISAELLLWIGAPPLMALSLLCVMLVGGLYAGWRDGLDHRF